jgi:hypothetical protein
MSSGVYRPAFGRFAGRQHPQNPELHAASEIHRAGWKTPALARGSRHSSSHNGRDVRAPLLIERELRELISLSGPLTGARPQGAFL